MHVAPEARIDDGLFDVVTLGDLSVPELLRLAPLVYRGEHTGHSKIHFARARTIRVEPVDLENLPQRSGSPAQRSENYSVAKVGSPKILLDVDGEAPGRLPATWTILPKALLLRG
jgi:diacylglycerol kinase family enzyme